MPSMLPLLYQRLMINSPASSYCVRGLEQVAHSHQYSMSIWLRGLELVAARRRSGYSGRDDARLHMAMILSSHILIQNYRNRHISISKLAILAPKFGRSAIADFSGRDPVLSLKTRR